MLEGRPILSAAWVQISREGIIPMIMQRIAYRNLPYFPPEIALSSCLGRLEEGWLSIAVRKDWNICNIFCIWKTITRIIVKYWSLEKIMNSYIPKINNLYASLHFDYLPMMSKQRIGQSLPMEVVRDKLSESWGWKWCCNVTLIMH